MRERKVETRFARKATKGVGVGIDDAVAAAEARVENMRGSVMERIGQMILGMHEASGPNATSEALHFVRTEADALVGLCGTFGLHEVEKAAASLCELYDVCAPDWPTAEGVRVHLNAVKLFWSPPSDAAALARPEVLEGLRQVVAAGRRRPSP